MEHRVLIDDDGVVLVRCRYCAKEAEATIVDLCDTCGQPVPCYLEEEE